MPPKQKKRKQVNRRSNVKKRKSTVEDANEYDRESYEVEDLIDTKLEGNRLFYMVKWKNWPSSANTLEPETRLNCESMIVAYIVSRFETTLYVNDMDELLRDVNNDEPLDFIHIIDPLATIGITTIQTGIPKFNIHDSVEAKTSFLKYVANNDQKHQLVALKLPSESDIDLNFKKYLTQLSYRLQTFPEHPGVEIMFPTSVEAVFYPPPPIYNLLFEPVTDEMYNDRMENIHMFPPKSRDLGLCDSQPYIRAEYFYNVTKDHDPRYHQLGETNRRIIKRMDRIRYDQDPRFGVNLKLRQEAVRGWILCAADNTEGNTPLMMMTGVIRPNAVAHRSLKSQGEAVAFSSFINIPDTGMCLDRRQYHDFSKFIPHSCNPTCAVRLVASGNKIPDLVIYSLVPLDAFNSRVISIDYYKDFAADVKKFLDARGGAGEGVCMLNEEEIDFIQCRCASHQCREVLYIDRSLKKDDKKATKKEKMTELDPSFKFYGLKLADPSKIWNIRRYRFAE